MRAEYTYTPLRPGQIRLLHILPVHGDDEALLECVLSHHDFSSVEIEPYVALSYTWGEESRGQYLLVDGRRKDARPNLFKCLQSLRHHNLSRYAWIDAICINQTDDAEKSVQLGLMGEIYARATKVAICLQSDDDGAGCFFETAENYRQYFDRNFGITENQDPQKLHRAVQWLGHNPYFRRMWVVQENVLAADRLLLCGTRRISWLYVPHMVRESEYRVRYPIDQMRHSELIRESGLEAVCDLTPWHQKRKKEPPAPTLFNALTRYRRRQCFDPRDKIYALLGLPEMQKPKIQSMCQPEPSKIVSHLFVDIIAWFESSPNLTGRHQTSLQRYALLQDALGAPGVDDISCSLSDKPEPSSLFDYRYEVKIGPSQAVHLPIVIAEAHLKGQVSAVSTVQRGSVKSLLYRRDETPDAATVQANLQLLEMIDSVSIPALGYAPDSEEAALPVFRNLDPATSRSTQQSYTKIQTSAGGWGLGNTRIEVSDAIYTVIVDQTQNNTPICVSLVLRESSSELYSVVSLALDHLGFRGARRRPATSDMVAPMPPRRYKGERKHRVQLVMDPKTALLVTRPGGCQTLGYGWRTGEDRFW